MAKVNKKSTIPPHAKVRSSIRAAVIPHAKNNYRPHLIRRQGLAIVLLLVACAQLSYNFVQTGSVLGRATDISQQRLLDATNSQRAQAGAAGLQLNSRLNTAAQAKVNDMFTNQYWAHTSPAGDTPWKWVEDAGYSYDHAGENLAKGFYTSQAVVTAWKNSPEHNENMLDRRFTEVGFAVKRGELKGETTTVIVALYAAPAGSATSKSIENVLAASSSSLGLLTRIGVGVQSMTPALIGSIVVMSFVAIIAVAAHVYRNRLPKYLRTGWYRHHGIIKATGMASVIIILITLYGGGQI